MSPEEQELKRQRRVADLMTSMHATLRDRYKFRAGMLDAAIMLSSITLIALAFADPIIARWFAWGTVDSRIVIGSLAIVNFVAAMWGWRFDWKGKSVRHAKASDAYSRFKLELTPLLSGTSAITKVDFELQSARYVEIGQAHERIPESQFASLKSNHLHKIRLNKKLDEYPGAFTAIIGLYMRLTATAKSFRTK